MGTKIMKFFKKKIVGITISTVIVILGFLVFYCQFYIPSCETVSSDALPECCDNLVPNDEKNSTSDDEKNVAPNDENKPVSNNQNKSVFNNEKKSATNNQKKSVPNNQNKSVSNNEKVMVENVPYINQYNEGLVSGCEAVSSTMLLKYYGYKIGAKSFMNNYFIRKDWHVENDTMYAPDPNAAYVGNPYVSAGTNCGFGAFAPCTAKAINKVLNKSKHQAVAKKGLELSEIAKTYIKNGIPVLIWATVNMKEPQNNVNWTVNYTDENSKLKKGNNFNWISGEHCLVLIGYDNENYYFNDPCGTSKCAYKKSIVEKRYKELGKQCVYIK